MHDAGSQEEETESSARLGGAEAVAGLGVQAHTREWTPLHYAARRTMHADVRARMLFVPAVR